MAHNKQINLVAGDYIFFLIGFNVVWAQQMSRDDIQKGIWKGQNIEYFKDEILVKIKKGGDIQTVKNDLSRENIQIERDFNKLRWARI